MIDQADTNTNLAFVIDDTVDAIRTLREEGKRVFLHCVGGRSRTPTIAATYLADRYGGTALEHLERLPTGLPRPNLNATFRRELARRGG